MNILKRLFGFDDLPPDPPALVADDALAAAREDELEKLRREEKQLRQKYAAQG